MGDSILDVVARQNALTDQVGPFRFEAEPTTTTIDVNGGASAEVPMVLVSHHDTKTGGAINSSAVGVTQSGQVVTAVVSDERVDVAVVDPTTTSAIAPKSRKHKHKKGDHGKSFGAVMSRPVFIGGDGTRAYDTSVRIMPYSHEHYKAASSGVFIPPEFANTVPPECLRYVTSRQQAELFNSSCAHADDYRLSDQITLQTLEALNPAFGRSHMSVVLSDSSVDQFQLGIHAMAFNLINIHKAYDNAKVALYVVADPDPKALGCMATEVIPGILDIDGDSVVSFSQSRTRIDAIVSQVREDCPSDNDEKRGKKKKNRPNAECCVVLLNGLGASNCCVDDDVFRRVEGMGGFVRSDKVYPIDDPEKQRQEMKLLYGTANPPVGVAEPYKMAYLTGDMLRHFQFPVSDSKSATPSPDETAYNALVAQMNNLKATPGVQRYGTYGSFRDFIVVLQAYESPKLISQCVQMTAPHSVRDLEGKMYTMDRNDLFSVDRRTPAGTTPKSFINYTVHRLSPSQKAQTRMSVLAHLIAQQWTAEEIAHRHHKTPPGSVRPLVLEHTIRAFASKFSYLELGFHTISTVTNEYTGDRETRAMPCTAFASDVRYGLYARYPVHELSDSSNPDLNPLRALVAQHSVVDMAHDIRLRRLEIMTREASKLTDVDHVMVHHILDVADEVGPLASENDFLVASRRMTGNSDLTDADVAEFKRVLKLLRGEHPELAVAVSAPEYYEVADDSSVRGSPVPPSERGQQQKTKKKKKRGKRGKKPAEGAVLVEAKALPQGATIVTTSTAPSAQASQAAPTEASVQTIVVDPEGERGRGRGRGRGRSRRGRGRGSGSAPPPPLPPSAAEAAAPQMVVVSIPSVSL